MSIIVTGGAGFLGSRVIAALLARPQGLLPFRKQYEAIGNSPCGTSLELIASARVCRRTLRS